MMVVQIQRKAGRYPGKKEVGIWGLLQWAFQRELAQLDFDELTSVAGERPGVSMEYLLMQRKLLGVQIDGGGRSEPHPDADAVASALASLPECRGGRRTALWIAELARAGQVPDWMPDAVARCVPLEWKRHKRGNFAMREHWKGDGRLGRWPENQLGRDHGYVCPVRYENTAHDVARARRAYLHWHDALVELRDTFQLYSNLTAYQVTDELPPRTPWKQKRFDRMSVA